MLSKYFRTTNKTDGCLRRTLSNNIWFLWRWGGGTSALKYQAKVYHPLFHRQLRSFWQIWSRELVELIIMLSLLMLLLTTMTAVTATSNNKQSAQTTVQFFLQLLTFFEQLFGNFLRNYGIWGGESRATCGKLSRRYAPDIWWCRGEDNTHLKSRQEKRTHENKKIPPFLNLRP